MPIIPRTNPDNIADIAPLPTVRNTTRVSAAPALRMADATSQLANAAVGVYVKAQERADVASYMEAQNKLSDWKNHWTDPNNPDGMMSYKGREALQLRDAMLTDYDKRVSEVALSLPSDRARQKFTQYAHDLRSEHYSDINRYATAQNDAYIHAQRETYVTTQANNLVSAQLNDPAAFGRMWATTLDTVYAAAAANGEPPNVTGRRIDKLQSVVHSGVVDQLLATSPLAAMDYYTEHADQFIETDRARVLRALGPLYQDAKAEENADAAMFGGQFHAPSAPKPRGTPTPRVKSIITSAANAHGVPPYVMLALAEQESGFDPDAVNPVELDDGDHATGLFQYRETSTDGFDRTDPVASANAAAQDFRERMDEHGIEYAIAAHFAGDGGAAAVVLRGREDQNPKTAAYLEQVMGRANRWRERLGGETAPVAVFHGQAASEADALERVMQIENPRARENARSKVRARYQIQDLREQEADRSMSEQINTAVEAADPSTPLGEILDPEAYAWAARNGYVAGYERRLKQRRAGEDGTDDHVLLAMERVIYRASLGNAPAMAAVRNLKPYDPSLDLSGSDRANIASAQIALLGTDPEQKANVATEAELRNTIETAIVQSLGIDDDQIGSDSESGQRAARFNRTMRLWAQDYEERNGRKPSYRDVVEQVDRLTLEIPIEPAGFFGDEQKAAFEVTSIDQVPQDRRASIVLALRQGGYPPSEANILRYYKDAARAGVYK